MSCCSLNSIASSCLSYALSYSPVDAVVISVSVSVGILVLLTGGGGGTAVIVVVIKWRNKKKEVGGDLNHALQCVLTCTHTHTTHFFFVTPCPLRTSGRSQAEGPRTCLQPAKVFLR